MRIRDNPSVTGVAPVRTPPKPEHAAAQGRRIVDVATVIGVPNGELPAGVHAALAQLMEEVERLRKELEISRQRIAHLERLADQDDLLPLANRRAFVRELTRMAAFVERYGAAGSVLYFDVNDLKKINDTYGHTAGDAALRRIAEILIENVRSSDFVGRLGGDEFGVILAQTDLAAAQEKAATLQALVAGTPLAWEGRTIALSVAVGIHSLHGAEGPDAALQAADRAMYRHKRNGADAP